ncbi:amidohydrolase family protein [Nonomuraea antimicrobica]|uniref:Amidohydrolase family protein n=1 Tax=Nonomuraea antimicrobica TaxID=561173 RepID=A0ABP7E3L0_9ACTN
MRIDVHGHLVPEEWLDTYRRAGPGTWPRVVDDPDGSVWVESSDVARWPVPPDLRDAGSRTDALRAGGVDSQLLLPPTPLADYALPAPAGRASARLFNETVSDLARHSAGRFLPSCTVPLQDPDAAVEEVTYAARRLDARAVLLGTNLARFQFDSDELFPFFTRVSELGLPLVLHPNERLGDERLARHRLANLVGNPVDTTVAVAQLIFGGVLERLPELRVCLVHGGGALPFLIGRWVHGAEALGVGRITRSPDAYLDQIYADTIVHDDRALELAVAVLGADHLVIGSDDPYAMGDPELYDRIARAGLSEDLLSATAGRLLGLDATATPAG